MNTTTPTSKSLLVTYLLWLCLGWTGAHRYYLGRYGSAVFQSILLICFFFMLRHTVVLPIGILSWWLVDAFLIPVIAAPINADYQRWLHNDGTRVGQATPYEIDQINDRQRIALASAERGDYAGAIEMSVKALKQAEQLFGRRHIHVGVIKSHLGEYYRQYGDLKQAYGVLSEAIAIMEASDCPLDAAAPMSHLVLVYMATEQYDHVEQMLTRMQSLLTDSRTDTPLYYQSLVTYHNQRGQLALVQGDFAQAFQRFESGTALVGRLPEDNGGLKLRMLINAACALIGQGQMLRAAEYYQRAWMLYRNATLPPPADVSASLVHLAQTLQQEGIEIKLPTVVHTAASPGQRVVTTAPLSQADAGYVAPVTEMIPFHAATPLPGGQGVSQEYVALDSVVDLQAVHPAAQGATSGLNVTLDKPAREDPAP